MENQAPIVTKKNHWKTVGIILIILAVILAATSGYLLWAKNDQKSQIDNLNSEAKQTKNQISQLNQTISTLKESAKTENNQTAGTTTVQESYDNLTGQLQAALPNGSDYKLDPTVTMRYQSNGYQSADIAVFPKSSSTGGFVAMFYRTSAKTDWKYFMGTQNDMACSLFNTSDLKKAFAGKPCVNPDGSPTTL